MLRNSERNVFFVLIGLGVLLGVCITVRVSRGTVGGEGKMLEKSAPATAVAHSEDKTVAEPERSQEPPNIKAYLEEIGNSPHLYPTDPEPSGYDRELKALFSDAISTATFYVIVTPSFTPEYLEGVRTKDGKHFAFRVSANEHVWGSAYAWHQVGKSTTIARSSARMLENIDKIGTTETTAALDQETFEAIRRVWDRMLLNTRAPKYNQLSQDGTTFVFHGSPASADRPMTGYTWSPSEDSIAGNLVTIANLVGDFSKSNDPKTMREIKDMCEKLSKRLASP